MYVLKSRLTAEYSSTFEASSSTLVYTAVDGSAAWRTVDLQMTIKYYIITMQSIYSWGLSYIGLASPLFSSAATVDGGVNEGRTASFYKYGRHLRLINAHFWLYPSTWWCHGGKGSTKLIKMQCILMCVCGPITLWLYIMVTFKLAKKP